MTTDLRDEGWRLAVLVAMTRLGILSLQRNVNGAWIPPTLNVAADPAGTKAARRKYRKLWRRALARDLREFDKLPKRRQKREYGEVLVNGKWKICQDAFGSQLLKILALDVGRKPRRYARGARWERVKECCELRKTLLQVAKEFGLLDPKRNM